LIRQLTDVVISISIYFAINEIAIRQKPDFQQADKSAFAMTVKRIALFR